MRAQSDLVKKIPIVLTDIGVDSHTGSPYDPGANNQRDEYPSDYAEIFRDPQSQPGSDGYGAGTGMNPEVKPYDHGMVPGGKND